MVCEPFCAAVSRAVDARGPGVAVVTVHSFTPVHFGEPRAVELGILHDEDSRLAYRMLARAGALPHWRVARNEPYGPDDGVMHSLKLHALSRGLANVMIEVRNDLLRGPGQTAGIAREILTLLEPALKEIKRREDGSW